jgi:hypothetical protein
LFAIGLSGVFSLTGWYRQFHARFLWSRATQDTTSPLLLHVRGYHPLWPAFPRCSISIRFNYVVLQPLQDYSYRFGLFRVRSPLLTESFSYFLLLQVLRCFSSLRFSAFARLFFKQAGCPIQTSTDQSQFATPRSFSQLITSFVFSESLGIPHTLLFAFLPLYNEHNTCVLYFIYNIIFLPLYLSLLSYVN